MGRGTGRYKILTVCPVPFRGTKRAEKKRTFLNRKEHSITGKDVLKQENDVQKQEIWSFFKCN